MTSFGKTCDILHVSKKKTLSGQLGTKARELYHGGTLFKLELNDTGYTAVVLPLF